MIILKLPINLVLAIICTGIDIATTLYTWLEAFNAELEEYIKQRLPFSPTPSSIMADEIGKRWEGE